MNSDGGSGQISRNSNSTASKNMRSNYNDAPQEIADLSSGRTLQRAIESLDVWSRDLEG